MSDLWGTKDKVKFITNTINGTISRCMLGSGYVLGCLAQEPTPTCCDSHFFLSECDVGNIIQAREFPLYMTQFFSRQVGMGSNPVGT
jgi:hypothetical protein